MGKSAFLYWMLGRLNVLVLFIVQRLCLFGRWPNLWGLYFVTSTLATTPLSLWPYVWGFGHTSYLSFLESIT